MIRNYESNEKTEEQCASISEVLPSVFLFLISQMCSQKVFQKWMDGWYLFCQEGLHIWWSISAPGRCLTPNITTRCIY